MYRMSCGNCNKPFAPENSKHIGFCKCLILEKTTGEVSVLNQEEVQLAEVLHNIIISQHFDLFNHLISQKNSEGFVINAIFLKRVFFLENTEQVSISGLLLLQPTKLQHVLGLRPELIINYLYIDILPTNWPAIDELLKNKLLTTDLIHAALEMRKFDLSTASKSSIIDLKNGLIKRNLLNKLCRVVYFGENPKKLSKPTKIASYVKGMFSSTAEALRAKLLAKQIDRQIEKYNQVESAAAIQTPEVIPEIDFSEFEEKPAAKVKRKKKKKVPTIKVEEVSIESPIPDAVSTEIPVSEEPEHIAIDEPLASPCEVTPLIESHTSPESSATPALVYEKKEGLNRKQRKRADKHWKSMADKLNSRDNWTLLKALTTFKSTKHEPMGNVSEEPTAILQAPIPAPNPHGYYLYPADFPRQLHSVIPLLIYLESHNYMPIIYGSMVTKSLLAMLKIENTLKPGDIDVVLYNAPGLGEHLAKSGGKFEPNIYNSTNPNYEQYRGSFDGVLVDITVQKEGYKTNDPIDFTHFMMTKEPKNLCFEFKLKSRNDNNFETIQQLESAVNKVAKGQFDIFLPNLFDHRIIYKGYFSRVIKYIQTWNGIFPLFQAQNSPNLACFLHSPWKDSYIRKLNGYFTRTGISFAYLELAELIIKHQDKLNDPLINDVLTSFFNIILADGFRPGLINKYKQAVLINTTGSELKKEDVIRNITKLKCFSQSQFAKVPAYKEITTEWLFTTSLDCLFSVPLPPYNDAISASASRGVVRYG